MNEIVKGCIEVVNQGKCFLNSITGDSYVKVVKPFFISSSGEHMRHILDHFTALKNGLDNGLIDYDQRQRGSHIETKKSLALLRLNEIEQWIISLDENSLDQPLIVKSEVALSETLVTKTTSTLARELMFATSHAVHHYATIAVAIQMLNLTLDKNFGIAPATASYFRTTDKSCAHSPG